MPTERQGEKKRARERELYVAGHVGPSAQTLQQGPRPPFPPSHRFKHRSRGDDQMRLGVQAAVRLVSMAGEQMSLEDSVFRANLAQAADDLEKETFAEQLADMCKAPIDLVSDEDSEAQGEKRGRSCGEAPCEEEALGGRGGRPAGTTRERRAPAVPLRRKLRLSAVRSIP